MAQVAQLALALTPPYPVSEEQKLEWLRKGRIIHYPAERPVHLSVSSWDSIRTVRAGMLLSLFDRASRSCPSSDSPETPHHRGRFSPASLDMLFRVLGHGRVRFHL